MTDSVRVLRVIARLNVGGPSIQAITLTRRMRPLGYDTTLVRGREGEREGSMDPLAMELGVEPVLVPALRRDPGWHDLKALWSLVRILRHERPAIVHTHAAKAGTIGRLACVLAFGPRRRRPLLVHTFHGHSLSGYFSPRVEAVYRTIERALARVTDRLIAVSEEVRDELVAMRVAPREQFEVVRLGFDLSRFAADDARRRQARAAVREQLGIPRDALVVTLVARLVPIKRVDRFLRAAAMLSDIDGIHFLIVGDGELRDPLKSSPDAVSLRGRATWAGFRRDMPEICFASDIAVLTSDNEGTPVSLIEAAGAGLPTISTRVGGAATVVLDGTTGLLVDCDEGESLMRAIRRLAGDDARRDAMGAAGREHALSAFSLERLIDDVDALYRRLLASRKPPLSSPRVGSGLQGPADKIAANGG